MKSPFAHPGPSQDCLMHSFSLVKMHLPQSPTFLPDEQSFLRCCFLITGFQNDECARPLQASREHGGEAH